MVTKNKTSEKEETKGRVNLDKLELNKETVKDLSSDEAKQIQGGAIRRTRPSDVDPTAGCE